MKSIKMLVSSMLWWITNVVIANFPSKTVRLLWLKLLGMSINGHVNIYEGFHIRAPRGIVVEDGVSIGPKVLLDGRMGLRIESNAVIAYDAIIWTLSHDYNDVYFRDKGAPVTIGAYSWICSRSIIMPGVTVGKGAVIASGAVVTKNVPDFAIMAGVPAKKIGERSNNDYLYGYKH